VSWIDAELVLVSLAAMVSPTTLTFSVLALVLGDRPLRTGFWFFLGAFGATLAIGVAAAFLLGDDLASHNSTPKTWVAVFDVVAGSLLILYVVRTRHESIDPRKVQQMVDRMSKVASSRAVAVVGAGAVLANPGAFIPIALKTISEEDPSPARYIVDWLFFTAVSLLPLAVALLLLIVAREWAEATFRTVRDWLVLNARTVAAVIIVLLAASLLRNGIAGLAS
jgi:uncharacterized membrane protein